ncbi:MAG: hypothetical protein R2802_05295 [Flavobacteriaceae bacterium]|nr:hypothetical protein [Mangrovimonas sp.]MCB0438170.1 hypothetical protein [Mangrovimonas sp.]HPF98164.1 hypothetical protein [Mangrovimonas sp.]HRV55890.1 hypothetical protein [Mangrovimonas sp.]
MTENSSNKPNGMFWAIAIIAVIWNIMGVLAYLSQAFMTEEALASLPEKEQQLCTNIPAWATAAFAVAVWFGLLGSILLLLRKGWAKTMFLISLLGILVQMYYNLFISKAIEVYGPGGYIMPALILIIGVFLVWYSKQAKIKGYIS